MHYQRQTKVPIGREARLVLPSRVVRARLAGMYFEPEKTFLLPSAMTGIRGLRILHERHPAAHLLVVGHTDREGNASYNLGLSQERAQAIVEFLHDDVEAWLRRYRTGWGVREDQHMMKSVAGYLGKVDGQLLTSLEAVKAFQRELGQRATGAPDEPMRRELVRRYLTQDGTSLPPSTPIVAHGCGELHPEVATADGVGEARNRRVEVFLFDGGIVPPPRPTCPPPAGCREHAAWLAATLRTVDLGAEIGRAGFRVTKDGQPARGVTLTVEHPHGAEREHTTDEHGEVWLEGFAGEAFALVEMREAGRALPYDSVEVTW